jgi:hypothetical protein
MKSGGGSGWRDRGCPCDVARTLAAAFQASARSLPAALRHPVFACRQGRLHRMGNPSPDTQSANPQASPQDCVAGCHAWHQQPEFAKRKPARCRCFACSQIPKRLHKIASQDATLRTSNQRLPSENRHDAGVSRASRSARRVSTRSRRKNAWQDATLGTSNRSLPSENRHDAGVSRASRSARRVSTRSRRKNAWQDAMLGTSNRRLPSENRHDAGVSRAARSARGSTRLRRTASAPAERDAV